MLLYVTETSQNNVYVFAVRKENVNMVLMRKQTNIVILLLHVIPINESTMVSLGGQFWGCFLFLSLNFI